VSVLLGQSSHAGTKERAMHLSPAKSEQKR